MSIYTLMMTMSWSAAYVQGSPLTEWGGNEPATTIATMIRNSLLNAPLTWPWNRAEDSSTTTIAGQQDYTVTLANFGFLEKASLQPTAAITNVQGTGSVAVMTVAAPMAFVVGNLVTITGLSHTAFNGTFTITAVTATTFSFASATTQVSASDTGTATGGEVFEITEVHNTTPLSPASNKSRPNAIAIITSNQGTSIKVRLMSVPQATYVLTLTYQIAATQFGPFTILSVAAGTGVYTGIFNPLSFPAGSIATIVGCTTSANNGSFVVTTCTSTLLTVVNSSSVSENETTAFAMNYSWGPIPDQYSDVYNNLFLSEAMAACDDPRAQQYRQRGVAALLAKADGLTETQKNAFAQQWLSRSAEINASTLKVQQGQQARSV